MDKWTKVLIAGISTGALTYGVGQMYTRHLERRVHELQVACVAEADEELKREGALGALARAFSGKFECDPVQLAKSGEHAGIQGQLAVAQADVWRWSGWPFIACVTISVTCALPWLWYFFLRRVRELHNAIMGK